MENRRRSRGELFCFLFLVSDYFELGENRQNPVKRRSPDEEEGARAPKKKRPTDKKTRKEELEQQRIEEEREWLTELSRQELLKVALAMKIIVNGQTAP